MKSDILKKRITGCATSAHATHLVIEVSGSEKGRMLTKIIEKGEEVGRSKNLQESYYLKCKQDWEVLNG